MNLETFNKLSKKNQDAILEAATEVQQWSIERSIKEDNKSIDFLKSKIDVIILSPNQQKDWKIKLLSVKENWLKKANTEEKNIVSWIETLN
jgi:TRAP-type C4-dicarboxylate transport system substrate-binding protein